MLGVFTVVLSLIASEAALPPNQQSALQAFFAATVGSQWTHSDRWLQGDACSNTWLGVQCNAQNSTVLGITFNNNNLGGTLPSDLLQLADLQQLDLEANSITGAQIPAFIWNMTTLTVLNLAENNFAGTISAAIGQLVNLRFLDIDSNAINGPIPVEFGNLVSLQDCYIDWMQLSGGVPSSLANLRSLTRFYINNNQMQGSVPAALQALPLEKFRFNINRMTVFPERIGNVPTLLNVWAHRNQFTQLPSFLMSPSTMKAAWPLFNGQKADWDFSQNPWAQPTPLWCSNAPLGNSVCGSTLARVIACPALQPLVLDPSIEIELVQNDAQPAFANRQLTQTIATEPQTGLLAFVDSFLPSLPANTPEVLAFRLLATPNNAPALYLASFDSAAQFQPAETISGSPMDFAKGAAVGALELAVALVVNVVLQFVDVDGDQSYTPDIDTVVAGPFNLNALVWFNNACNNRSVTQQATTTVVSVSSQPPYGQSLHVSLQASFSSAVGVTPASVLYSPLGSALNVSIDGFPLVDYSSETFIAASIVVVAGHGKGNSTGASFAVMEQQKGQYAAGRWIQINADGQTASVHVASNGLVNSSKSDVVVSNKLILAATIDPLVATIVFVNASGITARQVYATPQTPIPANSGSSVSFAFSVNLALGSPPCTVADDDGGLSYTAILLIIIGAVVVTVSLVCCVLKLIMRRSAREQDPLLSSS